jgi:hypothetical protein
MLICPDCKQEIKGLNRSVVVNETLRCSLNEAGEYKEDSETYETLESEYSCPDCSFNFDFIYTIEEAAAFLKGEGKE